jgi:hypothetical protein
MTRRYVTGKGHFVPELELPHASFVRWSSECGLRCTVGVCSQHGGGGRWIFQFTKSPAALWLWSRLSLYQESSWGVERGLCVRLTTSPYVGGLSKNLGASTTHNHTFFHGLFEGYAFETRHVAAGYGLETEGRVGVRVPVGSRIYSVNCDCEYCWVQWSPACR